MSRYLTVEDLQLVMPRLKPRPNEAQSYVAPLNAALERFEINTNLRMAAFLAQIAHESYDLKFWKEVWGPTPAQKRYEPPSDLATRLGNTEPGDGERYKGRGPIQLTGRANYRAFGESLGFGLEQRPQLVETPEVGFLVAGQYWQQKGCNALADAMATPGAALEQFAAITRKVNGGLNGIDDRVRRWTHIKNVLNVSV